MARIFFISLLSFIGGFLLKGILENWAILSSSFWDVKITDIIQVLILSYVGIYASYYINVKSSNEEKQKEIISSQIERLLCVIAQIYSQSCEYLDNPLEEKGRKILSDLKDASISLGLVGKNLNHRKCLSRLLKDCRKLFFAFRRCVTGESFLSKKPVFPKDIDKKIHRAYANLYRLLDDMRFKQYI